MNDEGYERCHSRSPTDPPPPTIMLKKLLADFALAAFATLPFEVAGQDETDRRPGIAVMQFENAGSHGDDAEAEDFAALEVGLQIMLTTELSQNGALRLVERSAIQNLLAEQDLSLIHI